jgi:ABC-type uncharacterized transport system permease subunit
VTALLYLVAAGLQLLHITQRRDRVDRRVFLVAAAALACHGIIAWQNATDPGEYSLGFYKVAGLIFLVVNVACLATLVRRPLQSLLVVLFPLSAMAVLVAAFAPDNEAGGRELADGVMLHIASSILAYAVLTLAALQAGLLAVQDRALHQRNTRGIIQMLPPLQLMEQMLFELVWVGVILLSLSIGSGFLFLEDIFAQHLVHKTVLTILAWLLFSILLWGHYQLGWRARTAVRLTLSGFALLLLAFFGSKLVLELMLQR